MSASVDDAEENIGTGGIDLTSTDLELVNDGVADQEVGMRFTNITIPQGATINSATIQFTVDEVDSGDTDLTFYGEDTDDAGAFTTTTNDITNRTKTTASVAWDNVPVWDTIGEAGADQKTPDLSSVIQEIVDRSGWSSGNDIVIVVDGTGDRAAESYDGSTTTAPLLELTWTPPATVGGPKWEKGKLGQALEFDGTDDYVDVDNLEVLNNASTVTLAGWFRDDNTAANKRGFGQRVDGNNDLNMAAWSDGRLYFEVGNGSNSFGYWPDYTATIPQGTWYHAVFVFDGTKTENSNRMKIYVNGIQRSLTFFGTIPATTADLATANFNIGRDGGDYWIGLIDDVRVYNYALTQKQITSVMNADHPAVGSPIGSAVAHYKFDESYGTAANDSSLNANTLTLNTASSAWLTDGKFDKAWHGYGSNWLSRADDDDFDFTATDDFTISTWFRSGTPSNPGAVQYLVDKYGGSQGYAVYANTNGTVCIGIDDDASWDPDVSSCSTTDIYDQQWHHLVATRNISQDTLSLFVNGKLAQSSNDTTTATLANTTTLYVGDDDGDATNSFTGDLDELKIYRYALNTDEVKLEYNQGKSIVLGALSTDPDGITASNSAARAYCPPGDTATCNPPVGHWTFDERTGTTANDISGNNNTGTLTNDPKWEKGKLGQALDFDGVDDYISIPDNGTLLDLVTGGQQTIAFWLKAGTNTPADGIMSKIVSGDNVPFIIRWDNAVVGLIEGCLNQLCATSSTTLNDGNWRFVVFIMDDVANEISLWVDTEKQPDTEVATPPGNNTYPFEIGRMPVHSTYNPGGPVYHQGLIDDVRIYNYARTPAQIAWDYNRGAPIAHYEFDTCSGTIAYDESDNRYNGTINPASSGNTAAGTCGSGTVTEMWNDGTNGKFNASLGFDGIDDYVQISDTANLRFDESSKDFSLFSWIKRTNTDTEEYILSKEDADNDGWRLMLNASNQVVCSQDTTDVTSTTAITDTNWHLIGCTIDRDGNGQVYIDGIANGSTAVMGTAVMATTSNIRIGTRSYTSTSYFNGLIDDVRIYNYVLTPGQVKLVYNEGSAVRFGPLTGSP